MMRKEIVERKIQLLKERDEKRAERKYYKTDSKEYKEITKEVSKINKDLKYLAQSEQYFIWNEVEVTYQELEEQGFTGNGIGYGDGEQNCYWLANQEWTVFYKYWEVCGRVNPKQICKRVSYWGEYK